MIDEKRLKEVSARFDASGWKSVSDVEDDCLEKLFGVHRVDVMWMIREMNQLRAVEKSAATYRDLKAQQDEMIRLFREHDDDEVLKRVCELNERCVAARDALFEVVLCRRDPPQKIVPLAREATIEENAD